MNNLNLYRISEEYSNYLYEQNNKVLKSFEDKKRRPFVRHHIRIK